ncbi:MAG: transglutaminase-like domain-containing protein [Bacteroidota bacterium]
MEQSEVNALVNLLDDPDDGIYTQVKNKLLTLGEDIIPILEDAHGFSFDHILQNRIENIIRKIQFDSITAQLKNWAEFEAQNLLSGAMLVAKYQYPDLDEKKLKKQLALIKKDIWLEFNEELTGFEKVRIINHILYDIHGFSGNTSNIHAPQNSYINDVLETKNGSPLSLSILYIVIAQGLGMPVYGINLPKHFILACTVDDGDLGYIPTNETKTELQVKIEEGRGTSKEYLTEQAEDSEGVPCGAGRGLGRRDSVLFYINPFNKGAVFGREYINAFLKQIKLKPEKSYYHPCTNIEIIQRLLSDLNFSYHRLGDPDKIKEMGLLMDTLGCH